MAAPQNGDSPSYNVDILHYHRETTIKISIYFWFFGVQW